MNEHPLLVRLIRVEELDFGSSTFTHILVYETGFIALRLVRRLLSSNEGTLTSLVQVDDIIVTLKPRRGSFKG